MSLLKEGTWVLYEKGEIVEGVVDSIGDRRISFKKSRGEIKYNAIGVITKTSPLYCPWDYNIHIIYNNCDIMTEYHCIGANADNVVELSKKDKETWIEYMQKRKNGVISNFNTMQHYIDREKANKDKVKKN